MSDVVVASTLIEPSCESKLLFFSGIQLDRHKTHCRKDASVAALTKSTGESGLPPGSLQPDIATASGITTTEQKMRDGVSPTIINLPFDQV